MTTTIKEKSRKVKNCKIEKWLRDLGEVVTVSFVKTVEKRKPPLD